MYCCKNDLAFKAVSKKAVIFYKSKNLYKYNNFAFNTCVVIFSNRKEHPMDYSFNLNEQFSFYHPLMREVVRVNIPFF